MQQALDIKVHVSLVQEINSTHTARQAKSRDIDENRPAHKCEMSVLICVKSKHGCSSGMMSWTFIVHSIIAFVELATI